MTPPAQLQIDLDLAGMPASPYVAASTWPIPGEVVKHADGLIRHGGDGGRRATAASAPSDFLMRFVRLTNASDAKVLAFAKKFGVLGICGHQLPFTHVTGVGTGGWRPQHCIYRESVTVDDREWTTEPIERWRDYARLAGAILAAAAALHQDQPVPTEVWEQTEELAPRILGIPWSRPSAGSLVQRTEAEYSGAKGWVGDLGMDVTKLRDTEEGFGPRTDPERLEWALRHWMQLGAVTTWVDCTDKGFRICFGGETLFGALASQLAVMISRNGTLYPCSGCGNAFHAADGRGRGADQDWWCEEPKCKKKSAAAASRRYREEQKRLKEKTSRIQSDRLP